MIWKLLGHVTTSIPATRPENTTSYRNGATPASPSTALIAAIRTSRLFLVLDAVSFNRCQAPRCHRARQSR